MSQYTKNWEFTVLSGKLTPGTHRILNVFEPPRMAERFFCVRYKEDNVPGHVHTGDVTDLKEIPGGWQFVTDSGAEYQVREVVGQA